jgi:hypothetical protein
MIAGGPAMVVVVSTVDKALPPISVGYKSPVIDLVRPSNTEPDDMRHPAGPTN